MVSTCKAICVALLSVWAVDSLAGQWVEHSIGGSLEAGAHREFALGTVTIYAGSGFAVNGEAQAWSIYSSGEVLGWITPLIFEKVNDTDYILRAMGASRGVPGSGMGVASFHFDPEAGQPEVGPRFTFGFTDRITYEPTSSSTNSIVTSSRHAGVVDFRYEEDGKWYATSNGLFELSLGQRYSLKDRVGGDVIPLRSDPLGRRSYSAQMTASGVPAAPAVKIQPGIQICWNSLTSLQYRVQWTAPYPINWQDFGDPVRGTGSVVCVADTPQQGDPRFYRVIMLP